MAFKLSFFRLLARSLWLVPLFAFLAPLITLFWPVHKVEPLSTTSVRRNFQDGIEVPSNVILLQRDTYQCSSSNPCSNGACCGASGYCGYGPTYCGSGCVSNCNATSECGQYAATPGQECPLNVCCSQYGFVCHISSLTVVGQVG